jgi:hypothetical protein
MNIQHSDEVFVFNFEAYKTKIPTNYPVPPDHFLEWLVGFTEGDGCFVIKKPWLKKKDRRLTFSIAQKDRVVLDFIKESLGFGNVSRLKIGHFRYDVYKISEVRLLIY